MPGCVNTLASPTSRFFCGFFSTAVTIPFTFSYALLSVFSSTSRFALRCFFARLSLYIWNVFTFSCRFVCVCLSFSTLTPTIAPNSSNSYLRFSFPLNALFATH